MKEIEKKRDILFAAFSNTITKTTKDAAWEAIAEKAKSVNVIGAQKNGKFLRDVTWQNWRKRAIEKRDKNRRTGAGGGKKVTITEMEELVFRIIGPNSASLDGMKVPESSGTSSVEPSIAADEPTDASNTGTTATAPSTSTTASVQSTICTASGPSTSIRAMGKKAPTILNEKTPANMNAKPQKDNATVCDDTSAPKDELVRLQCMLVRKELYLKQLKITKLENELQLTNSQKHRLLELAQKNEVSQTMMQATGIPTDIEEFAKVIENARVEFAFNEDGEMVELVNITPAEESANEDNDPTWLPNPSDLETSDMESLDSSAASTSLAAMSAEEAATEKMATE